VSGRAAVAVVLAATLAGLIVLVFCAPEYLAAPGLPLDDAWTHAVYARSLASTGRLEFTPGIASGGPSSPLWAALMSMPHLVGGGPEPVLVLVKLLGLALHIATALLLLGAFAGDGLSPERVLGAALVAFHPDLVSASVSGVETPLASAVAAALLWAARAASPWMYAALAALTPFVRPELIAPIVIFPLALYAWHRPRLLRMGGAGVAGVALGAVAVLSGFVAAARVPSRGGLPGTKGLTQAGVPGREVLGFTQVLDQFPVADSSLLLAAALVGALYFAIRAPDALPSLVAPAALLGGLTLCAVAFALMPAAIPGAFFTQRHALPALPLLVGSLPVLLFEGSRRCLPARATPVLRGAIPLLLISSVALDAPIRYQYLANDTRNVGEVQAAMGNALAQGPATQVVWASDAVGGLRYLAPGVVIDLSGANSLPLRGPVAQDFLDAHRPHFIEIVPRLSTIDRGSGERLKARAFRTTTPDTAGGAPDSVHQRWLLACTDPGAVGRLHVAGHTFDFRCAEGGADLTPGTTN
jgi:hypothetical protein